MAKYTFRVRNPDRASAATVLCSTIARCVTSIAVVFILLAVSSRANAAIALDDDGYFVEATQASYDQLTVCNAPECTRYLTDGGTAYTTDYTVAQMVYIYGAQDGETLTWEAIKPDNTVETLATVTYSASTGCFTWATGYSCGEAPDGTFWDGPYIQDEQIGMWTLLVLDNGEPAVTHQFYLSAPPLSWLTITSPAPNQLIDLAADQNWTATDATCPSTPNTQNHFTAACFSATTNSGNPINWTANLSYATSGGYGQTTDSRSFSTPADGTPQNEVYQSEGGQVIATASTTAIDGSLVQSSVTLYVDGPISGITNANISNQLGSTGPSYLNSYPNSPSYPSGGTAILMEQAVTLESSYQQFRLPGEGNPAEPDLYHGIDGKWPTESTGGGKYIGLTQVPATPGDEWNWITNTSDGVNVFSGNPVSQNKITIATSYENQIISQHTGLVLLSGFQLENAALVFYGGYGSSDLTKQYYVPVRPSPGKVQGKSCKGAAWIWTINSAGNPGGVTYANNVRAQTPPQ